MRLCPCDTGFFGRSWQFPIPTPAPVVPTEYEPKQKHDKKAKKKKKKKSKKKESAAEAALPHGAQVDPTELLANTEATDGDLISHPTTQILVPTEDDPKQQPDKKVKKKKKRKSKKNETAVAALPYDAQALVDPTEILDDTEATDGDIFFQPTTPVLTPTGTTKLPAHGHLGQPPSGQVDYACSDEYSV